MQYKYEKIFKASIFGVCFGSATIIASLFVSATNGGSFYTASGIGIIVASLITLLFGMSLSLMDEVTEKKEEDNFMIQRKSGKKSRNLYLVSNRTTR